MQADAEQAYVQAVLTGTETWVCLPPEARIGPAWANCQLKRPVVRLRLALYGHPDAGGFWEEQCDKAVKACGFIDFKDEGWRSTYWHPKEKSTARGLRG